MPRLTPHPARAGFTLLEVVIVLAVLAIGFAIAVPYFGGSTRRSRALQVATEAQADLQKARAWAVARREVTPGNPARAAGFRVVSDQVYEAFADPDDDPLNGNELVIERVDLAITEPSLRIEAPGPGAAVRFRPNGTASAFELVLLDEVADQRRRVRVSSAGFVSAPE